MKKIKFVLLLGLLFTLTGCEPCKNKFAAQKDFELNDISFDFELLNPDDESPAPAGIFKIDIKNSSNEKIWIEIHNGNSKNGSKFVWSGKIEKGDKKTIEKTIMCVSTDFVIKLLDSSGEFISKNVVSLSKKNQ